MMRPSECDVTQRWAGGGENLKTNIKQDTSVFHSCGAEVEYKATDQSGCMTTGQSGPAPLQQECARPAHH